MSNEFVVVSDIHGNAPSLQAVIDHEGYDKEYVILGDIMGLNAYPKQTLQIVQHINGHTLAGNHDKALFHHDEGHVNSDALSEFELSHTMDNLSPSEQAWMADLPFLKVLTRSGQRICLTHAMPWPEMASGYEAGNAGIQKSDVTQIASVVSDDYDYVFHGHTHAQYDLDCSQWGHDVHFVNPGSLGYDQTYSVVETDHGGVTHKSVESTYDEVKAHIKEVLPDDAPSVERWY